MDVVTYALCKKYTDSQIIGKLGLKFEVVEQLPATGESNTIYFVPSSEAGDDNIYDEYVWIADSSSFEKIGSTAIDLTDYVQDEDMVEVSENDIDDIFTEVFGGDWSTPAFTLVYNNATSGTTTYSVNANGIYLIISSYSANGQGSITLPAGRTALLSQTLSSTNQRGMKWVLVELQRGDSISIYSAAGAWLAFSKAIFFLENSRFRSASELVNSTIVSDGLAQLNPPNDSNKYLVFGVGMGRGNGNYSDNTSLTGATVDTYEKDNIGSYTVTGLYYGTGSEMPVVKFYGYDGGCGCVVCIKV